MVEPQEAPLLPDRIKTVHVHRYHRVV